MFLTKAGKSREPDGALPSSHCVKVGVKSLERSDSVVCGGPEKKLFVVAAETFGCVGEGCSVGWTLFVFSVEVK